MIGRLAGYFLSITAAAMLAAVAQSMIPSGKIRKIAALTGGALLLMLVLSPLLELDELTVNADFSAFLTDQSDQIEQMEKEYEGKLSDRIKRTTEEYISDKALSLGISVQAEVETILAEEGYFYPYSVTVKGRMTETQRRELAAYLTDVLGIPEERQVIESG